MKRPAKTQTVLALNIEPQAIDPHCSLCGRKVRTGGKKPKCKWCFKGGEGDPPMPEMGAFKIWRKGLMRVLRDKLTRAGHSFTVIEQTMDAVFFDRGTLPVSAQSEAQPYLDRLCTERRYNRAREQAVLAHHIFLVMHKRYVEHMVKPFLCAIEEMRTLSRSELVEYMKRDKEQSDKRTRLSWHIDDLSRIVAKVILRLRGFGITTNQRVTDDIILAVVEHGGLDESRRLKPSAFSKIAADVVADELSKRNRRLRVATDESHPQRIRVATDEPSNIDLLADEEARASAESEEPRVRVARVT